MSLLGFVGGLALILLVLLDAFETIVLPRRASGRIRLTALFYRATWALWRIPARHMPAGHRRENFLAFYGPLSLLVLLGVWSVGLILGFAVLLWAAHSPLVAPEKTATFGTDLYASGTTFFTLGLGDVVPRTSTARALFVAEVGMGFAFLALVIGYLPVLYQAFSRREVSISLLDARAGSPPTAFELFRRFGADHQTEIAREFLSDWEKWAAELLETHLSYPILGFYRSQHENQSWLAALAVILDAAALVTIGVKGVLPRQGSLTFAMARHTIVDLAQVYVTPPKSQAVDRLPQASFERLQAGLREAGVTLLEGKDRYTQLAELRQLYEPYLSALAEYLLMPLPGWVSEAEVPDNWVTTAWGGSERVRL